MTTEEARKIWIEALRSDKYSQTRQRLHDKNGYCCLGVACELFSKELEIYREFDSLEREVFDGCSLNLPRKLADFLGLVDEDGSSKDNQSRTLTDLNDHKLYTFKQIADELETGKYWRD
jgi:hypothetical protein